LISFIACHETLKRTAKGILQPNANLIWVSGEEVDGWLEDAFDKYVLLWFEHYVNRVCETMDPVLC